MAKKNKAEKVEKEEATQEFKYGVQDIADELGIKPASVRVQLRNKGIEKAGKAYGWNTKSELKEVISQLKASTAADEDDEDEDEAPKKSKKKAKADKKSKKAKKAKSKKARDEEDEDEDDD